MANIDVQSIVLTGWQDIRTSGIELWVFSDRDWVDVAGIPHGAGDINDRVWTQRVPSLVVNTTQHTLTIPLFTLTSTRDAIRGSNVRLHFWVVSVVGNSITPIDEIPNTQNGLTIPAQIISGSGCTPLGTCASWSDLIQYNTPSPSLPVDTYPTRDEVTRLVAQLTSGGSFAPSNATYLLKTAAGGLANAQVMGSLGTGLVKNTTGTGVQSIGVAGTDYQAPISATAPVVFASNTVSMPVATAGQNGYLAAADWTTFNSKQAALGFTPENAANKNATNGYAGLSAGKLTASQGQEVWSVTDLTDYATVSGTGTVALRTTISAPVLNHVISWDGSNWINAAPVAGFADPMTTRGDLIFRNSSNVTARLPLGAANRYISSNGTDASWAQVDLTAGVTGLLPPANGGIGLVLGAANRVVSVNSAGNAHEYRDILFGATGNFPNATYAANSITLHFPLMAASSVTSGMLSNAAQTIPGLKTFSGGLWDKGGQVFNVMAYGAVGDNSTDDAAAIQAANDACAAAGGGVVYFPQPPIAYKFNSTLNLGNGNATTVSTYDGVRWVGVGSGHSYLTGHRPAVKLRWGGGAAIMIKINGPIAGAGLEELFLDGNSTATGAIQAVHSAFTVLRRIIVTGIVAGAVAPNNNVAVDIDSYNTNTFNGGSFVGVQGFNGLVEDLSINTVGVNNITLLRIGNSGPVAQWQFKGGGIRGDGGTGGTAITLGYCDHNYFWGVTAKAATGLRVRPIAGVANFPVNNFFNGCSINATSAANSYVIDNSLATWAPATGYGLAFWGLPTIDGGVGTTPTDNKFWGVTDQQEMFGGSWSVTGSAGLSLKPYGAAAGNTNEIRFLELAANGVNYIGFKAPDAVASNAIYTLPAYPVSNMILQSTSAGVLSWVPNAAGTSSQVLLLTPDTLAWPQSRTLSVTAGQHTLTDNGAGATVLLSHPAILVQPTMVGGTTINDQLILRGTSNAAPSSGSIFADIFLNPAPDYDSAGKGSVRIGATVAGVAGGVCKLEIIDTGVAQLHIINSSATSAGGGAGIQAGYSTVPSAADHRIAFYTFGAKNGASVASLSNGAAMVGFSSEAWTISTAQGSYLRWETTPKQTATRIAREFVGLDKNVTDAATSLFEIALAAGTMAGGQIEWTIIASNGTDHQAFSGITTFAVVNKAGTYTKTFTNNTSNDAKAVSSGTLTATWAAVDGTNKVTVQVTPTGSLTETTYKIFYKIINNSPQVITLL